jgi:hypothetical protein
MHAKRILTSLLACALAACFAAPAAAAAKTKRTASAAEQSRLDAQDAKIEALTKELEALKDAKAKDEKPTSGYDHGFFMRSADGDYLFKFRFFTQIFYEFDHNPGANATNSFGLRRARMQFLGNVFSPNLTYMIMPELVTQYASTTTKTDYTVVDTGGDTSQFTVTSKDTNDRNFRLLYLWAQYRFCDEFQIRAGEFIPPTEFFFRASNLLTFGDFPIIATAAAFTPNFQTGVDFLGTIAKKLDYELFAVNGSNFDQMNLNKTFRTGLSLTYNILGKPGLGMSDVDYSEKPQLALTVAGSYEKMDQAIAAPANIAFNDTLYRAQTNAVFRYRGFSFAPEFILLYDNTQHFKHYGIAGQAGYFIIPKHLEAVLGASYLDYSGPSNDVAEYSGGLNYYFYGQPVKLQADYSLLRAQSPGGNLNTHRARLTLQFGFF